MRDKPLKITWKPISTPLNPSDVIEARKFRLYILVRDLLVQHETDGGTVIPAGRMVFLLSPPTPRIAEEYVCKSLYVAAPDRLDYQTEMKDGTPLPPGVLKIKPAKGKTFRILVAPKGKEKEWLDISQAKSRASRTAR